MFGVYIHIPFCAKKCPFCDFSVTTRNNPDTIDAYFEKTLWEIQTCAPAWSTNPQIDTVFFGGGTPSLVEPHHLGNVLRALGKHFAFSPDIEISMECNPEDVSTHKVQALQEAGINRFSLGVQHFEDVFLQTLGRVHTAQDVENAINALIQQKAQNWSLDLIFGVTGQSLQNWQQVLQRAASYQPPHISTYELTIEPNTVFGKQVRRGQIRKLPDTDMAAMFEYAKLFLEAQGYQTYETSNAAKPGHACKHNLSCWHGDAYWGIGVSAHSRMINNDIITRIENPATFSSYMQTQNFASEATCTPINAQSYAEECIWTGLRLRDGIEKKTWLQCQQYVSSGFQQKSQRFMDQDILRVSPSHIHLAPHARIFADAIALDLLSS